MIAKIITQKHYYIVDGVTHIISLINKLFQKLI